MPLLAMNMLLLSSSSMAMTNLMLASYYHSNLGSLSFFSKTPKTEEEETTGMTDAQKAFQQKVSEDMKKAIKEVEERRAVVEWRRKKDELWEREVRCWDLEGWMERNACFEKVKGEMRRLEAERKERA